MKKFNEFLNENEPYDIPDWFVFNIVNNIKNIGKEDIVFLSRYDLSGKRVQEVFKPFFRVDKKYTDLDDLKIKLYEEVFDEKIKTEDLSKWIICVIDTVKCIKNFRQKEKLAIELNHFVYLVK